MEPAQGASVRFDKISKVWLKAKNPASETVCRERHHTDRAQRRSRLEHDGHSGRGIGTRGARARSLRDWRDRHRAGALRHGSASAGESVRSGSTAKGQSGGADCSRACGTTCLGDARRVCDYLCFIRNRPQPNALGFYSLTSVRH